MGDIFKNAFEAVIVGTLALVCFAILLGIFPKVWEEIARGLSLREHSTPLVGTVFLAVAYVLGSAVFPFADERFNRETWLSESDKRIRVEEFVERAFFVGASTPKNLNKELCVVNLDYSPERSA
jgi:multisubunit Na+/H+ antiporter MnhB subunit